MIKFFGYHGVVVSLWYYSANSHLVSGDQLPVHHVPSLHEEQVGVPVPATQRPIQPPRSHITVRDSPQHDQHPPVSPAV